MATTYNFTNASISQVDKPPEHETKEDWLIIRRNILDFSKQTIEAGASDVAQAINIPAGTTVLNAWIRVITAETANATVDLGYGSDVDYWGNALPVDATGIVSPLSVTTSAWNVGSIDDGNEAVSAVTVDGAALGDLVHVTSSLDVQDLTLAGQATAANEVTIQFGNWTGGAIDVLTPTITIYLDKAPLAKTPVYFSSADTIDLVATTDTADVDLDALKVEVCALCLKTMDAY